MKQIGSPGVNRLRHAERATRQVGDVDQLLHHLPAGFVAVAPPWRVQRIAVERAGEMADGAGFARIRHCSPALHRAAEAIHEAAGRDHIAARVDHRRRAPEIERHVDIAPLGIPGERSYLDAYLAATGQQDVSPRDWFTYLAFCFFRVAGIRQGIMKRVVDGNATSMYAHEAGMLAGAVAELGWQYAERAMRL